MKHPDNWKEFILAVIRKFDFNNFGEDFSGPLIWTHEGRLIGTSSEFVSAICENKFGIRDLPKSSDAMFKQIASDNLEQVRQEQKSAKRGPSIMERCEATNKAATASGLVQVQKFDSQRRCVVHGATMEMWISSSLVDDFEHIRRSALNLGGAELMPPVIVDKSLIAGTVGIETSHYVFIHPSPFVTRQLAIVPTRHTKGPYSAKMILKGSRVRIDAEGEESLDNGKEGVAVSQGPPGSGRWSVKLDDGEEKEVEESIITVLTQACVCKHHHRADSVQTVGVEEATDSTEILVYPHNFRNEVVEDLAQDDFQASMEVLTAVGGVMTWMGLRGCTEYRNPLDTHLTLMPFPFHSAGEDSPVRYPLELMLERAVSQNLPEVSLFPFRHILSPIKGASEGKRPTIPDLAKATHSAYMSAKMKCAPEESVMLAFTMTWLLVVPLMAPGIGDPKAKAWEQLPPPPPCALAGVVISVSVPRTYPETAASALATDTADAAAHPESGKAMISNRAEQEGIPKDAANYDEAVREVCIDSRILEFPTRILSVWATQRPDRA